MQFFRLWNFLNDLKFFNKNEMTRKDAQYRKIVPKNSFAIELHCNIKNPDS